MKDDKIVVESGKCPSPNPYTGEPCGLPAYILNDTQWVCQSHAQPMNEETLHALRALREAGLIP